VANEEQRETRGMVLRFQSIRESVVAEFDLL